MNLWQDLVASVKRLAVKLRRSPPSRRLDSTPSPCGERVSFIGLFDGYGERSPTQPPYCHPFLPA